jgi:hypothetical protein
MNPRRSAAKPAPPVPTHKLPSRSSHSAVIQSDDKPLVRLNTSGGSALPLSNARPLSEVLSASAPAWVSMTLKNGLCPQRTQANSSAHPRPVHLRARSSAITHKLPSPLAPMPAT